MAEPGRVAESVASMRRAVDIPITVKCRIGIEPRDAGDDYVFLHQFVEQVADAGCSVFIIHARKAILTGLSPKENREIPPLRFDIAERLRVDFPKLTFVVNGGIRAADQVAKHLGVFDGVMLGREICDNPYRLVELHRLTTGEEWAPTRESIVESYLSYVRARVLEGHRLAPMLRHILSLYAGQPRARSWRRFISERAALSGTTPEVLSDALRIELAVSPLLKAV
jgi:tRNA-dihydrouridine synthase A